MASINNISTLLRTERMERGMTVKAFAEFLGISMSALEKYERGAVEPGTKALYKIAKTLNYSQSFLFSILSEPDLFSDKKYIPQFNIEDENYISFLPNTLLATYNLRKNEKEENHICICIEERCFLFIRRKNNKRLSNSPIVVTQGSGDGFELAAFRDNVVYDIFSGKKHKCQTVFAQYKREINK